MAKYLLKVNFTLAGMRGVAAEGASARKAVSQAAVKSVGGKLESYYFAFGATDVFLIVDLPDNTAAAAVALAVSAGGGATVQTIPLLTVEEIDAATGKKVKYTPPGA